MIVKNLDPIFKDVAEKIEPSEYLVFIFIFICTIFFFFSFFPFITIFFIVSLFLIFVAFKDREDSRLTFKEYTHDFKVVVFSC